MVNVLEYSSKVQVLIESSNLNLGTARRFDVFQVFRFGCCTLPKTHMEPENHLKRKITFPPPPSLEFHVSVIVFTREILGVPLTMVSHGISHRGTLGSGVHPTISRQAMKRWISRGPASCNRCLAVFGGFFLLPKKRGPICNPNERRYLKKQ